MPARTTTEEETRSALHDLAERFARQSPGGVTAADYVNAHAALLDAPMRAELARRVESQRTRRMGDADALDAIHALMSGHEWHAGTIETVAELLAETGRVCAPPEWH